jgi:hypothetical protein
MFLTLKTLPALHAAASSPEGSAALLAAITTTAKRQHAFNAVLAALVQAKGQLQPASAGVIAAVPGAMGRALAEQLVKEPANTVEQAYRLGEHLAGLAAALLPRAAALLDAELGKAARVHGHQPATRPGHNSKPWALEARLEGQGTSPRTLNYRGVLLSANKLQSTQIIDLLETAVSARKQPSWPRRRGVARQRLGSCTRS